MPLCCFDIGNNGISLLKRRQQFDGGQISASKSESRRKYAVLIKFDIGIPMLARTMLHWYRLDAVPLSRWWNSVVETTSTIRYRIDHSTSPNLSYANFISLRYSSRHRIDIDLMQFVLRSGRNFMIWQAILIRIHNGIIKPGGVTMENIYIFAILTFATNFIFPRKS